MKQLYSLMLAMALPALPGAAAQVQFLREIVPVKQTETFSYTYDNDLRVIEAIHTYQETPDVNTRTTYQYDAQGHLTEQLLYQNLLLTDDPADYVNVSRYTFGYDSESRVAERMVYIYAGEGQELMLGSKYAYQYNDNGTLNLVLVYPPHNLETPSQRTEYTYDTKGLLSQTETFSDTGGSMMLLTRTTYSYSQSGRLDQQIMYSYVFSENRLGIDSYVDYLYNEDGSLKSVDQYNNTRLMLLQQKVYLYDEAFDTPISDVVFPLTFEDEVHGVQVSPWVLTAVPPVGYELRGFNEYSGLCELDDVFDYEYSPESGSGSDPNGIAQVTAATGLSARLSGGRVVVEGLAPEAIVTLVDAQGRCVYAGAYGSGVEASSLPAGVYIVATEAGAAKIAK